MPDRVIAIGDVHGCLAALHTLLDAIEPQANDTIIMLGDYVDRGSDSRGVLDELIALKERCRLVPILGNHDEMLLQICDGQSKLVSEWLAYGGDATTMSYDGRVPEGVPPEHIEFLNNCLSLYETERYFFVHGSYWSHLPLSEQPLDTLRWDSLKLRQPGPHCSGKIGIVGHSAQRDGEILELGYLRCIDTCCYGDGWLTALDVESGRIWQADKQGEMRG